MDRQYLDEEDPGEAVSRPQTARKEFMAGGVSGGVTNLRVAFELQSSVQGLRSGMNCSSIESKSASPRYSAWTLPWRSIKKLSGSPRTPPYNCPSSSSPIATG